MGNPKNRSRAIKRKKVVCVDNKKLKLLPQTYVVKKSRKESG